MKVVLATHKTNQWLGVNKYFYLLGKHLLKLGVDVTFIVDSVKGVCAVNDICGNHVGTILVPPTATNAVNTARYCWNLRDALKNIDFNILHCGHVLPYFYLRRDWYVNRTVSGRETSFYRHRRKAVVFQPFGNELFTLSDRGMNHLYCKLAQPILRSCGEKADVLLAEGDWQLNDMRRFYPNAKRVEILPVGVDVDSYAPKISHESHGLFQFLAVNSLLPYEGMDELLNAFKVLNGDCKLVIVGTGSEEARLKQKAKYSRVVFKKNLSEGELYSLYRESDAFVCPTYETDVQMGVLEAMAMGLPVIARDSKWLPDSVIKFDGKGLQDMMFCLSRTSPSKRAETAEKGFEDTEQYSFRHIAKKALKIYESLL